MKSVLHPGYGRKVQSVRTNIMQNAQNRRSIGPVEVLSYLKDGLELALSKECRVYVLVPILINFVFLSFAGYELYTRLSDFLDSYFIHWPSFLTFLAYIISFVLGAAIIFACCYIFSTVATIIASPFYGLLADRAEMALNGTKSEDTGFAGIIKDIPRIMLRELKKQLFFIPRVIVCLIITVIPVVNAVSPLAWFLLTAWMGCLQYCDYAYDNHKIPFAVMRRDLARGKLPTFTFGAVIALCLTVPVLNLVIPPAAVCAGTRYYLEMQKRYAMAGELAH